MPIKGSNLCGVRAANRIIECFTPQNIYYCEEKAHGRVNSWTVCSYPLEENQTGFELYENANMLYSIYRTDSRYQNGTSIFYLTNHLFDNNKHFLQQVREYWNIENLLHYERDVRFKQDTNKIKDLRSKVTYSITDAKDWANSNKTKFADLVRM
ncbi:MAG: hypothetical protein RIS64_4560 [Bacteroidota bacterium]